MIRPRPARWFEALVARDDATLALEALAATGAIELQARPGAALPASLADVRPLVAQFAELSRAYRAYWPQAGLVPSPFPETPVGVVTRALERVRAWAAEAEPVIARLQATAAEQIELDAWQALLEDVGNAAQPLDGLAGDGQARTARLIAFRSAELPSAPPRTLLRPVAIDGRRYALALGPPQEVDTLVQLAAATHGDALAVPEWLEGNASAGLAWIAARRPVLRAAERDLRATLDALAGRHGLSTALADAQRLGWVVENVHALESGDHFCLVTGWTSETDGRRLSAALDASGARALLHFPEPPEGLRAPLLFANPPWARPFEVFAKALGMPSRDEVDPSVVLAITAPLLFGYMFGDVGQGLVIAAIGFALRRRFAIARLFIAGGLSATAFGLVFGSVFSLHALPPLWVDPLARPIDVLAVPIAGGAVLMALGLVLAGVEAHWRGEGAAWLATDAALIVVYVSLVCAPIWPPALAVAAIGAMAFCTGHAMHARRSVAAGTALAELVERTLQLLINTLSFARVGAFALAHAGLSSAIVALMDAASGDVARAAVLVTGNVVVIALETLVVSIQTTRLVLFEFFTRFLHGTGRAFRPLPLPPSTT